MAASFFAFRKKVHLSESFFYFVSKNFINFRKRKDFIHTVVIFVVYSISRWRSYRPDAFIDTMMGTMVFRKFSFFFHK